MGPTPLLIANLPPHNQAAGGIITYANASTSFPTATATNSWLTQSAVTQMRAPSVTPPVDNTMLIWVGDLASTDTIAVPTIPFAMTQRFNNRSTGASGTAAAAADRFLGSGTASVPTGDISGTAGAAITNSCYLVVLRPP